jgi:hypothetical protein
VDVLCFNGLLPGEEGWINCTEVDHGADCELRSQGRPFNTFLTIHRMVKIAFGNRF